MDDRQPVSLARRALSYLICYLVAVQPMLPAVAAQITPVTPDTKMDAAGNGVPVVNIATPNGAGISHNQYQQYNVGKEGLILNNATGQLTQTQLGGLIQNNPNLKAGHEAQAIINEVVGANRSQLQGYTEVAGKAANVMVANPYGITCNGCGFINTPNVTLTTGKPQLDANGNLAALEVTKGSVIVEGQGLDGINADAVSIVARATEINAGIHAKDLSVTLGANRVGADGSVTPIAGEGAAPSVAVDTGALGGMYANRIHLVSSEKGVGVNLGNLVAKQGDIQLDASGKLTLNNSLSSGALTANAESVTLGGENKASGQVTLSAQQDATLNKGTLVSDAGVSVTAKGNLIASGASITAGRDIQLSGATVVTDSNAVAKAGNDIRLQAQDRLSNSGQLTAGKNLNISAKQLDNSGMLAGNTTGITTSSLQNGKGAAISGAENLTLNSDSLLNQGVLSAPVLSISSVQTDNSGLIQGSKALTYSGNRLNNLAGGTLSSDNSFALNLPQLSNSGLITSKAGLTLSGDALSNSGEINAASLFASNAQLNNQQGGLLLADNNLSLQNAALTNDGQIAAATIHVDASLLNNSGTLQGKQSLQASGKAITSSGTLLSDGKLTIAAYSLTNRGQLQGQQLAVTAGRWNNSGNALSAGDGVLNAATLDNSGKILGQQSLQLKADSVDNSGWLLAQALTLQGDLVNSGLIQGSDALTVTGNKLSNKTSGQLLSAGKLTAQADGLDNQGSIQADTLDMRLQSWQNAGSAQATTQFLGTLGGALDNSGTLLSQNDFALISNDISNSGTLAANRLSITAPQLTNAGLLQGNRSLSLNSANITNAASGQLISGGSLTLSPVQLTNAGLLQVADDFSINGRNLTNSGRITATNLKAELSGTLNNSGQGVLLAQRQADIQASTLNNSGSIAAQQLNVSGDVLKNQSLLQGDNGLSADFRQFSNLSAGQLLSDGILALKGTTADNAGVLQGNSIDYQFGSLTNSGTVYGIDLLKGQSDGLLDNRGSLTAGGNASLTAGNLQNSGKVLADRLVLRGNSLSNSGLWQGTSSLDAQSSGALTQAAGGKTLSGGELLLNAADLNTSGTIQGDNAQISAGDWQNQGSLLGTAGVSADVAGELRNSGEILSQGTTQVSAQNLNNSGSLLADKAMTLSGDALNNSGSVQGETLAITPASVTNQGSLIGLQSLTISPAQARVFRMLAVQSQPARELINNAGGQLLTQGTLNIAGDVITNNGSWQGQQILLNATRLANNGAIKSAGDLTLNLSDGLTSSTGSKITANGNAALNALSFTNQGQWIAGNLTLNGTTLSNDGEISGVNGLTAVIGGTLTQQQNGALLSGGKLDLQAAALSNGGRIQGGDLTVNTGTLTNNGRLQGDNSLLLNTSGRITNNNSGTLISQSGLTLVTPELYNFGLIQGATNRITASSSATNSGKLLSAGELTLTTPQLVNSGWLQAAQLTLNAANASNSGTLLADQQGTLTGSQLLNQGTAQGGTLAVNYDQLNNSGTLLGVNQLNVKASQVTQQAAGKLFSGGNLLLESTGFDHLGQVVALGDATLKLINSFTARNTLAAGNRLTVTSNGAIENQGTLQGQALTLSAGGDLTNNGQLTTGTGDSSLRGQRINMNSAGTLQGGGNITLASRSDVALNGFTGTRGSLSISSPGSIVNTALLYAGQNLYLYANSIQNQRGDMLAGNSLWMQRDAAGNANGEVINTSGTIESQNGDITIRTGHLLNQRDGYQVTEETHQYFDGSAAYIDLPFSTFDPTQYTLTKEVSCGGGRNDSCHTSYPLTLNEDQHQQKVLIGEKIVGATASGGAARISAGRDIMASATTLDNVASDILAGRNAFLSGDSLNNSSSATGRYQTWQTYDCGATRFTSCSQNVKDGKISNASSFRFGFIGQPEYVSIEDGYSYRAVIQAGGNVNASFSGDISNTSTTSNAGWTGTTVNAPALNQLAAIGLLAAQQRQQLAATDNVAINSPEWRDQLQNALQQINGGTSLQNAQPETVGLSNQSGKQQGNANLGKAAQLASGSAVKPSALGSYGASAVDTSAYPLPNSDNGYFVPGDSSSPYLITVNPKLNGLGQLDASLFGDLNQLLGKQPGSAPQESRQQYTDVNTFLGSSYLLDKLNLKPDNDYRFLGDAAFDTRYVSNTVLNQTGSRYLNGVGSDLDQMRYLMDNAAASQQSLGLQFGVSLTADQVASLDKSIIWWEATSVNGQTVMVPKVYLSEKDTAMNNGSVIAGNNVTLSGGNISNSASSIVAQNAVSADSQNTIDNLKAGLIKAGGDLNLSALNSINNVSSTISGKKVALESVNGDINNTTISSQWTIGGSGPVQASKTLLGQTAAITSLDVLSLKSGNDINITGASLNAGGDLLLNAWHDLSLNSIESSESRKIGNKETHSSGAERTTVSSGGNMTLVAGQDITSQAAALAAEGDIGLQAGRDINLNAVESRSGDSERGSKKTVINEAVRQQGTEITSGGNLSLAAGRDITSKASDLTADQDLALKAGRDVNISTATESDYAYREETKTKKGFLKKTTTHTIQEDSVTREKASQLSGNIVSVIAGNDLTIQGSSIAGDKGVALSAGNDLNIVTATNTESSYSLKEVKKSGLMGGGLGLSYGKQSAKSERNGEQVTQSDARSLVGAGNGAVSLTAGNNALIKGSDLVAGGQNGDISVTAKNIAIVAGQDQVSETAKQESKSSGFGLSLNLGPLDTVRNLRDIMNNTSSVYDQVKQIGNEFGASAVDSPAPGLTYGRSGSKASQNSESVYQSGSTLNASGNLTLKARGNADAATGNILVQGSSLNASGKATLDATRDIDITTAADTQKAATSSSSKSWSVTTSASLGALTRSGGGSPNNGSAGTNYGSKNSQMSGDTSILSQHTSSITAGSVDVTSHKGDISITGSTLTGTTGVSLKAKQGNVSVVAGEDRQQTSASGSDHAIGDLGGDGYSGTVGVGHNSWKNASSGTQQNTVRSGIVSTLGDVTVNAAKDVNLQGADIYARNALNVNGENINLDPAKDTHDASSTSKSSQYGITAQVSGYGVSMAQAADKVAQSHKQSDDPRLQAIYAAQAAMTALSAYTQNTAAVKVTVSATAGSSHQSVEQSSTQQSGSVLKAGGDVAVTAKQDITGEGVKISGDNVSLSAGRDIDLNSAVDNSSQQSSSGGSKYGVGVGFGLGGSQNGFSIELAASQNSANGNGSSITHHNSEVSAAGDLTVKAGQDVTLNGANLNGNHVDLNAGRNLEIASQQDRASYDSHQSASGFSASICVPPICAGVPVQGSASMSGSKIYNDFDSVQQQSGISAGDGGYNIYVGNHTQLDGAVIASSATPDKNHLSTGTLGWTDIENHANSGANGYSVAVSGSMGKTTTPASDSFIKNIPKSGQAQPSGGNSLPIGTLQQTKDRASSTTYSAISPGTIEIRNPDAQKQDVAQISRDTAAAENALKDKFDAQKMEDSLAIQREMAVLGQQAIQQTFDALKKQEKEQERNKLKTDAAFNGLSEEEQKKALDKIDKNVEEKYGIGSDLQIAAQAISGLFAGLAGGNVSGAVAAGAAPLLAQMVKQVSQGNEPMRILLHTLASGLIAKAQGGSSMGGAAGGLTAGLLSYNDALSHLLYGKGASELSADEKMLVANIVTLAGAVAGGAVDGSVGAGSGASAGRTEVENNTLSLKQNQSRAQEMVHCQGNSDCENNVIKKYKKLNDEQHQSVIGCTGVQDCVNKANEVSQLMTDYANRTNELMEKSRLNDKLSAEEQYELSILQVTSIQLEADRLAAIHNALMSGDSPEAKQLAINSLVQAAGTSAAGIAAGVGKNGKGGASGSDIETTGKTSGAENAATYAKLKDDLIQQNLNNIAMQDPRLAAVVKGDNGKLNYGVGSGTAIEADQLGKIWAGDGARLTSDGSGLMSADRTRVYRFPASKENSAYSTTGTQANFETYKIDPTTGERSKIGNGHLDIE
ncbi:hemagglutinin repeat-containing protein [Pantoea sp. X85]|uniref:hemagglutinin repeat-containing protein n=1 Tax=Pantoea sp. X85 TaxID=3037258 RepID=UPI0024136CD1|nr:hemagglutinin repeat-containing protein [Pantoea sp. X85]WFL69979.1 hemagglutinin repeat-containing protein [Pantoea sp. X85]